MDKRWIGIVIVVTGIVALLTATFSHSWYVLDMGDPMLSAMLEVRVGLRGVTACGAGAGCVSMEFNQIAQGGGSAYSMLGSLTFFVALVVAVAAGVGALLMVMNGQDGALRWAFKLSLMLLPLSAGVLLVFPGRGVETSVSWGPLAMVVGAIAIGVGRYVLVTADSGPGLSAPIVLAPVPPRGGAMATPAAPTTAAATAPPPGLAAGRGGVPATGAQRVVGDGKRVRFAATQLTLDDRAIHAETPDGPVSLAWQEIALVRAVLLPPEAPWSRQLIVDFAPLMGAPVRALPTTKLVLPELAATSIENLRRICREAIARAPGAEIDDATRRFAAGQAPAALLAAAQVHAYEQRFDG